MNLRQQIGRGLWSIRAAPTAAPPKRGWASGNCGVLVDRDPVSARNEVVDRRAAPARRRDSRRRAQRRSTAELGLRSCATRPPTRARSRRPNRPACGRARHERCQRDACTRLPSDANSSPHYRTASSGPLRPHHFSARDSRERFEIAMHIRRSLGLQSRRFRERRLRSGGNHNALSLAAAAQSRPPLPLRCCLAGCNGDDTWTPEQNLKPVVRRHGHEDAPMTA